MWLVLALRQARTAIAIMTAVYLLSLSTGIAMAHFGNEFTLTYRDALVARAHHKDPAARADDAGAHGVAALIDFSRNLGLAAIPDTIGGLTLIMPVVTGTYRGWVGGIVSVDRSHQSRLRHLQSGLYYVVTLILQLPGFILASAGGLHLGSAFLRRQGPVFGPFWLRMPKSAVVNVCALYTIIIPAFAVGAVWEYFVPVG